MRQSAEGLVTLYQAGEPGEMCSTGCPSG